MKFALLFYFASFPKRCSTDVASYMVSICTTVVFSCVYVVFMNFVTILLLQGNSSTTVVISPHVILREAIRGLNGSDPVFTNTSTCVNEFRYCISFDLSVSSRVMDWQRFLLLWRFSVVAMMSRLVLLSVFS
jgi:hypothetical protein